MPSLNHRNSDVPDLALGASAALSRSRSTGSVKKLGRSDSRSSEHSDSFRIDVAPEVQLSSFHFGWRHHRMPYVADDVHREFRSWIYSFAWEDPRVDVEHIKLTQEDEVLCITSGGENACVAAFLPRFVPLDADLLPPAACTARPLVDASPRLAAADCLTPTSQTPSTPPLDASTAAT